MRDPIAISARGGVLDSAHPIWGNLPMAEGKDDSGRTEKIDRVAELADALFVRHLQYSFSAQHHNEYSLSNDLCQLVSQRIQDSMRVPSRVVAVVGAGASARILDLAHALAARVIQDCEPTPSSYEYELKRLTKIYHWDREEFETQLAAISRTDEAEQKVRQSLCKALSATHPTLLTYEILAHLLKHRFIDAIVNFNFDELLDQSIFDELSAAEYRRIISDRDCEGVCIEPSNQDYIPLYIKPHGTKSDPLSLRFTRDAYYTLPDKTAGAITSVLGTGRCTILAIGYGFKSFDFNERLSNPDRLFLFHLSRLPLPADVEKEIRSARENKPEDATTIVHVEAEAWSSQAVPFKGTDECLLSLSNRLSNLADSSEINGVVSYRSVVRHETLADILGEPGDLRDETRYTNYLHDRTVLEVAISALRGHGLVSIASLVSDRCGEYFKLYKRRLGQALHGGQLWNDICREGGLEATELSNETFVAIDRVCDQVSSERVSDRRSRAESPRDIVPEELARLVCSGLRTVIDDPARSSRLAEYFKKLKSSGTEIEIHSRDDSVCSRVFINPVVLQTFTALKARTMHMLRDHGFDRLLVVAETAEWLALPPFVRIVKEQIKQFGREFEILVIVAFPTSAKTLQEEFGENVVILTLPWFRHNRHLTVTCLGEEPRSAIYFARRLRSLFVTPVFLKEKVDLDAVVRNFKTYARGSELPLNANDLPRLSAIRELWKTNGGD